MGELMDFDNFPEESCEFEYPSIWELEEKQDSLIDVEDEYENSAEYDEDALDDT